MKVIIQHNWTTGLGDLFCASTEYLNFIKPLKEEGYETELIFSFNGSNNGNKFIGVNEFDTIFDTSSFELFDSISVREFPIIEKEYNGTFYHHTQYGPTTPGQHWWDTYFDIVPDNIIYPNFNPQTFIDNKIDPKIFPRFNSEVYSRSDSFNKNFPEKHNYLQIRYWDYANSNLEQTFQSELEETFNLIKSSNEFFHIGSNNPIVNKTLGELPNVLTFNFKNLDLFSNDHSYYFYNKHISNDLLLDRLYDNLAEMISVAEAKKIFLYTKFSWISNFLFYGFTMNKNTFDFKIINNNLNLLNEA